MGNARLEGETRDDQSSLAPIQLDRLSVEEEAALMQTGKHGRLAVVAVAAVLLGAGVTFFLKRVDAREAYVAAAVSVRELRTSKLEAFARCALPDAERTAVGSKDRLLSALERQSDRMGVVYGRVLSRCQPMVDDLAAQLPAVRAPERLAPEMKQLTGAAHELARAVEQYRAYLGNAARRYEYVQALPHMEKIATAWASYDAREAELAAAVERAVE